MPGQFESLHSILVRLEGLADELAKAADQDKREAIHTSVVKLRAELADLRAQIQKDAEAGDPEALGIIAGPKDL